MRNNRSRKFVKKASGSEGAPAWMVTYSDMITLVLAFFVLLFSFAVVDAARFNEVMNSVRVTFLGDEGILEGAREPGDLPDSFFDQDEIANIITKVEAFIADKGLEETLSLQQDERGIVLEISDVLFFDPGKAELKSEAQEILNYVAELLSTIANPVLVEGHTDNVPMNTYLFPSNWELSVARAVTVVRYLVEVKSLNPERFAAIGYGEFHPVASNLTAEGRAKNRRVNIIITPTTVTKE